MDIKTITFKKIIIDMIFSGNENRIHRIFADEKNNELSSYVDLYSNEGINFENFNFDDDIECNFYGRIAIKILTDTKAKNKPIIADTIRQAFLDEFHTIIFFSDKTYSLEEFIRYANNINIIFFDDKKLKKSVIKKWFSNPDEFILEKSEADNYISDLISRSKEKLSFALGAGCSIEANISNWSTLSNALGYEMVYSILDSTKEASYLKMSIAKTMTSSIFNDFDKTSALDAVKSFFEPHSSDKEFHTFLKQVLYMSYESEKLSKNKLMNEICNCINKYKVRELLTYNFDSVLEQSLNNKYKSNPNEVKNSTTAYKNTKIYHVHGYIPYDYDGKTEVKNFVFTDSEYYENAFDKGNFTNSTQELIFDNYDVIFVGVSFTDSNLKQILRERLKKTGPYTNLYAFYKLPTFEAKGREKRLIEAKYKILQQSYFDTLGVKIIWVNDFDEIPKLLKLI